MSWQNWQLLEFAAQKNFTVTQGEESLVIAFTLCDNDLADSIIQPNAGWKLVLTPTYSSSASAEDFGLDPQIVITAAQSLQQVSCAVPVASLTANGYPGKFKYVLGFSRIVGGNDQTLVYGLLTGVVSIAGYQEPGVVCSVP